MAIEGLRVQRGGGGGGVARPFHPISRWKESGVDFSRFPLSLLPFPPPSPLPLDTMAQQSVTRVTGRRSGCHHKTFQLVIANINVAAPAHARCRADSHARHAVLTRPFGTRERVPGTRTLLFPLSAGWRTTVVASAATRREDWAM